MTEHCYVVIMAGGTGTRLWPLSRKSKPKQFQALLSEKTMIQETWGRVIQVVPQENIFVSTTTQYEAAVEEQLPDLKPENILLEPEARNTGPAIALVATLIGLRDPEARVATIASDHAIKNPEEFVISLQAAFAAADQYPERLTLIGINPTYPDTGVGYIKMGEEVATIEGKRVFTVDAFKEKPDHETAETYLASWEYLWNAGYFIFSAQTLRRLTEKFSPALAESMDKISQASASGNLDQQALTAFYQQTPSEPIDTLIVEKLEPAERLVIPSSLQWSDVGNWAALFDFLQEKTGEKLVSRGKHIDIGSTGTLVHGHDRLIATVGLEDIVIVDMDDALLVAKRDKVSGDIKKLIEKMREGNSELL